MVSVADILEENNIDFQSNSYKFELAAILGPGSGEKMQKYVWCLNNKQIWIRIIFIKRLLFIMSKKLFMKETKIQLNIFYGISQCLLKC